MPTFGESELDRAIVAAVTREPGITLVNVAEKTFPAYSRNWTRARARDLAAVGYLRLEGQRFIKVFPGERAP